MPNPGAPPLSQILGPPPSSSQAQRPSLEQILGPPLRVQMAESNVAKGIVGALNPANFFNTATSALTNFSKLAEGDQESGVLPAAPTTLEGKLNLLDENAAQSDQDRQQAQQEAQTTQALNQKGITPSADMPEQQRQQFLQGVQGPSQTGEQTFQAAQQGLSNIGQGLANIGGGISETFGQGAPVNPNGAAEGRPWEALNTPGMGTPEQQVEGSQKSFGGLEDIINGGLGIASAPISGAINAIPNEGVRGAAQSLMNAPSWAISSIGKWAAKQVNPNLTDDQLDQLVGKPLTTATGVGQAGLLLKGLGDIEAPPDPLAGNGAENNYFKLDKATQTKIDAIQSLAKQYPKLNQLIQDAQAKGFDPVTDLAKSNLLNGDAENPIITDGKINTTAGISQLDQFLQPYEGVISKVLATEGKSLPLTDIQTTLQQNLMDSGLTGARLKAGISNLSSEMEGLKLKAVDSQGNPWTDQSQGPPQIPLSELQKMKTDLYSNLNYNDGSAPAAKVNANTLKGLIEDNTESANVKELNNELAKHYQVRDLLEKLHNKIVKGGKLGKYFSKIGGQIAGGAVGALLGPLGEAGGAIAGGEVADFLKQREMSKFFGKSSGIQPTMSPQMQTAAGVTSS